MKYFDKFSLAEILFRRDCSCWPDVRPDHRSTFTSARKRREWEIWPQRMIFNRDYPSMHTPIGWGITCINLKERKNNQQVRVEILHRDWPYINIGTQLSLGRIFGARYQIAGSAPQKDSGKSENNRERGFGVHMSEMPQTSSIDVERDRERGNTFLKITVAGL
jgi:hypothetical protein